MPERVSFTTRDDVVLVGDWQPVAALQGAAVLLHMMPETRQSWSFLQRALAKKNIASIAIDLRGHGESVQTTDDEVLDFRKFTDEQHQDYVLDAMAAIDWLRTKGLSVDRIFVIGASIGANAALSVLTEEPRMAGGVFFSLGKDYRGLDATTDIGNVLPHQSLLLIAAEDDAAPFAETKEVFEKAPADDKVFLPYKVAGHGTAILQADSTLADKISAWISERLNRV